MIYNYHTHTHRCGHAFGTEEEYIVRAIENGIKFMGFSDHIPLRFLDGVESDFRVPVSEGKIYCEEIKMLREKFKDKIEISVGFEMEYYPEYFDETLKNAIDYGAEYLILGQHYVRPENTNTNHTIVETNSVEDLKNYVASIISAINKKVYSYIAHPDMLNFTGDLRVYQKEMRKLCVASRELNVPLEINFQGIRLNRNYPNDAFWQVVGEEKSPVTFGKDAHDVASAFDETSLDKAKKIVKKYNLNYIGAPELILIQDFKND